MKLYIVSSNYAKVIVLVSAGAKGNLTPVPPLQGEGSKKNSKFPPSKGRGARGRASPNSRLIRNMAKSSSMT